jgi:hypothetical protein
MSLGHRLKPQFTPWGPGPDETVPSRSALKVGEIDGLVISDGVLPLPNTLRSVAKRDPPGVRQRLAGLPWRRHIPGRVRPPDRHDGFGHDPEEAARVRVGLPQELTAAGEPMVASHLSFPSVGRMAIAGDAFRWVPVVWDF